MFIFGYPNIDVKYQTKLTGVQMMDRFKKFIKKGNFHTIQTLHTIPIIGSVLRDELQKENRVFPLSVIPYDQYDGNYQVIVPDNNLTLEEAQNFPIKLMAWFYSPLTYLKIFFRMATLVPYSIVGKWKNWKYHFRKDGYRLGGRQLLRKWKRSQETKLFVEKLEDAKKSMLLRNI
jgi:hypothetical protein